VDKQDPMRHLHGQEHLRGAFGNDEFGRAAERGARFFGTPKYIVGQSLIVVAWLILNAIGWSLRWDPYPFILLNLAFSTQAAYAAPLILLAGNRASLRDRMTLEHAAAEADIEDDQNRQLLKGNVEILKRVESLEQRILELETKILSAIQEHHAKPPA
jgi:uncharacterized membrane protein